MGRGQGIFPGEQANPKVFVNLLQGGVAAHERLAYVGRGYPSFQTWVMWYRQDLMFKHFLSNQGWVSVILVLLL